MSSFAEVLTGPLEVYLAPAGTAKPDIGTDPPNGDWTLVGQSGSRNQTEDGVTIANTPSYTDFTGAGDIDPIKMFIETREQLVTVNIADLHPDTVATAFHSEVTESDGVRTVSLEGTNVPKEFALVAKGRSALTDEEGKHSQWFWPRVANVSESEMEFTKAEPASHELQFRKLAHDSADAEYDVEEESAT